MDILMKEIEYLDYLKNQKRVKNAGFVKVSRKNAIINISVVIQGLEVKDTGNFEVFTKRGTYFLGRIYLEHGEGKFETTFGLEPLEELRNYTDICIALSDGRAVCTSNLTMPKQLIKVTETKWYDESEEAYPYEPKQVPEVMPEVNPQKFAEEIPDCNPSEVDESSVPFGIPSEKPIPTSPGSPVPITEPGIPGGEPQTPYPEILPRTPRPEISPEIPVRVPEVPLTPESPNPSRTNPPITMEEGFGADKYEQMERMFEKVHPYADDREYFRIHPKDLVVLSKEDYAMVNNSFLLHGHHSYHHILLGRIPEGEQVNDYIGVPGVYYDREREVAVLFGFEGFESMNMPPKEGDFGYYMKKVKL